MATAIDAMHQARTIASFRATRSFVCRVFRKPHRRVATWWFAAMFVMVVHTSVRSWMDDVGAPVRGDGLERLLFGGLPTIWLQAHLFARAPALFEWPIALVHASWFIVPWLAGLLVTIRRHERIGSFFVAWILLAVVALPFFALAPTRPPWMESPSEVTRIIAIKLGSDVQDSNPLAAMPSMHVALPMVIALWFFNERWMRPGVLMLAYTALIGFEVVFSGEHYVADVAGAVLIAIPVALATTALNSAHRKSPERTRQRPQPRSFSPPLWQRERAQGLIEFAFVTPFVLMFMFIIVDFGIGINHRVVVTNDAREGARYAAVGNSASAVQTRVVEQSEGLVTDPNNVQVTLFDGQKTVEVRITYSYKFITPMPDFLGIKDSLSMNACAAMRVEQVPSGAGTATGGAKPCA